MNSNKIKNINIKNNKIKILREISEELKPNDIESRIKSLEYMKEDYEIKIQNIDDELTILNNFKNNNKDLFEQSKLKVLNIIKS